MLYHSKYLIVITVFVTFLFFILGSVRADSVAVSRIEQTLSDLTSTEYICGVFIFLLYFRFS